MINQFTSSLFWDTDIKTISETDHVGFIIQRVCMLGNWNDWKILKEVLGIEKIKAELFKIRYLDKKTE